jgi:dTDP-4-amino-4,6-dideoxygalactose transaminase
MNHIPFNRPAITGRELYYMSQAIKSGHTSGDGDFTKGCQSLIQDILGVPKVLLTPSSTHALEMAAFLLNMRPGDEVIAPSYTFVSTINAFAIRGAKPVFIDIRKDTLNMDESQLEDLITARTKAIIPVHYAGVACEMERICEIGSKQNVPIVEDNAHGLFAKYQKKYLGTFGAMATQSFHETKDISCGEGGALLINDESLIEKAEIIREKGTNRRSFFRGEVDKYSWVDFGSSYLLSDLLSAYLKAQLEEREKIFQKRKEIWSNYANQIRKWSIENNVLLPFIPPGCEQSYHMFYMILPDHQSRSRMIAHLKKRGIKSVFHYIPLHTSPMGQQFGYGEGDLPVTESISKRLLRLPFYYDLSPEDQDRVIQTIKEVHFF